jgi:hypothetical protein
MGRKRLYATNAERLRAYRLRKQGKSPLLPDQSTPLPTPLQETTEEDAPVSASASRDHEDKNRSGGMLPHDGGDDRGGPEDREGPSVNTTAMLGAFRGGLPYEIFAEFERLNGTDELMLFYVLWSEAGLTKETVEDAAEGAGYERSQGMALAQHSAVKLLYGTLGQHDVFQVAETTRLFFAGLKTAMETGEEPARMKAYGIWAGWLKENSARLDAQLARTERLKRAAVQPEQQKYEEPTVDMLGDFLAYAWRKLEGHGIDPRVVLEKEKGLKFTFAAPVAALPAPVPTPPQIRVIEVERKN